MSSSQNVYIAVVDDDESLCRSLIRLLRAAHFQPIPYLSAEAFLADTKHPHFDCLLLDIHLGGMSGLELRQKLIADQDPTPVIFITALGDPELRAQAESLGCAGFFHKTTPGEAILSCIRSACGQ